MTPHQQVRALWRSVAMGYVISPAIRRIEARGVNVIMGWNLCNGDEVLATMRTARDVRFIRDREIARAVIRKSVKGTGLIKRGAIADAAAQDPMGPEHYVRDLIIAGWEAQIWEAMGA